MTDVPRIWREGEFARLEHRGKTVYGVVKTATSNGVGLIVEITDVATGQAGGMPVIWDSVRGTFIGVCGHPVELRDPGTPTMCQWIIYHGARNHPPEAWVVRRWDIYPNALLPARDETVCASLEEARAVVPPWLALLSRHPSDDPAVHEVWI